MRRLCLIVFGISALACSRPARSPAQPTATPESPTTGSEHADEDRAWAETTEKVIATTMPELGDIRCAARECTATLTGDNEDALVPKIAALFDEDSPVFPGAQSMKFGNAENKNGRVTLPLTIYFEP